MASERLEVEPHENIDVLDFETRLCIGKIWIAAVTPRSGECVNEV